ncbi:hypothetical protein BDV25DRAFT_159831 [Aspergillus avenaceus]|uniref:Uncharacterized protein n=1 Tax=Aspergillus avenaceus TaxID=36643 RepID=A0A5N6TMX9_ASPAV|nr:hypothetical protein BDV25DRAFT_159831 [Aspergillus avenaceus]
MDNIDSKQPRISCLPQTGGGRSTYTWMILAPTYRIPSSMNIQMRSPQLIERFTRRPINTNIKTIHSFKITGRPSYR